MKLKDFKWQTKKPWIKTEDAGGQIILNFGNYELSIIDDGYGGKQGLYEICVFKDGSMKELPGVTQEGDTVKGWLTESAVDAIISKMYFLTGTKPRQV